jgi:glycosyltransferase involved in cell wall biosynthesis
MTKFHIVIPARNCERYIKACIKSIQKQTHKNFRAFIIVDGDTTDETYEIARKLIRSDDRFLIKQQPERMYGLYNLIEGWDYLRDVDSDNPNDILLEVDGDDKLMHPYVLKALDQVYQDENIWLTYGSHKRSTGEDIVCREYPDWIWKDKSHRSFGWWASQLRSHRRFLWDSLNHEDMKDKDGNYYKVAWDLSYMLPLLDMCEQKNVKVFQEPLLLYNIHPQCDFISNEGEQKRNDWEIRAKPKYPYYKNIKK